MLYFEGKVQIPYTVIRRNTYIYYKYAAITSLTSGMEPEHFWNMTSVMKRNAQPCRYLEIPAAERKPGGLSKTNKHAYSINIATGKYVSGQKYT